SIWDRLGLVSLHSKCATPLESQSPATRHLSPGPLSLPAIFLVGEEQQWQTRFAPQVSCRGWRPHLYVRLRNYLGTLDARSGHGSREFLCRSDSRPSRSRKAFASAAPNRRGGQTTNNIDFLRSRFAH